MLYVIVKRSRKGANRTYTGETWELAGLVLPTIQNGLARHDLIVFTDYNVALHLAQKLSEFNPVGFIVEEYVVRI